MTDRAFGFLTFFSASSQALSQARGLTPTLGILALAFAGPAAHAEDQLGAPIACTLKGMPNARLVYVPEDPELSLRWSVASHDGSVRETIEPLLNATTASGKPYDTSRCRFDRWHEPAKSAEGSAPLYRFNYDCGTYARGSLEVGPGTLNRLWTEVELPGGHVDRRDYVIVKCF
jgi:hypothetical protein